MQDEQTNIPLDMFLELAFGFLFPPDLHFEMRSLEDVANELLRHIRGCIHGRTFRYLVEHGLTADYCEQWLRQRK